MESILYLNASCDATSVAFETVDAIKRSERRPGAWSLHERTAKIGTHEVVGRGGRDARDGHARCQSHHAAAAALDRGCGGQDAGDTQGNP